MNLRAKIAQLGPGLLYAGAAIGVSHLVQSTRAGADFGFQLLAVVFIVNILKYPIFEIGPRYAAATGESLLNGYRKMGKWAVVLFVLMTVATMFIVMAAITIVTAGLLSQLIDTTLPAVVVGVILLMVCMLVLGWGRYRTLDRMMKVVVVLLTVSTVITLVLAFIQPSQSSSEYEVAFEFAREEHLWFLVALIGWMPAPVDISIWHSLWSVSKAKEMGRTASLKTALTDFRIGYWGTMFLAAGFLALGALVMYGTGVHTSSSSVEFAGQLISMYTLNLGDWVFPFIALATFTTMFSTMLTCLDAFPRTLRASTKLLLPSTKKKSLHNRLYWIWILVTSLGTSIILLEYLKDMKAMVDLATTISFLIAPVFAILNYRAMHSKHVSASFHQPTWLRRFNLFSIVLLCAFSLWFILS